MSASGVGEYDEAVWPGDNEKRGHPWFPPRLATKDPISQGKLVLNNTLTNRKEVFVPMNGRRVRWYTCGPTVYDSAHLGHARAYLSFDIMRRIMTDYFMYSVLYQINITDIDDKIILRARQNELIRRLKERDDLDFEGLSLMIDSALEEEKNRILGKISTTQDELNAARVNSSSRVVANIEEQLQQSSTKLENLEIEMVNVSAAKSSGDKLRLLEAGRASLAAKLDREQGSTLVDHSIFSNHSRYYEEEFMQDMAALGIREPDVLTRVTEYIPEIIEFIQKIIDKGMAYESGGSVYLSLEAFQKEHGYRKLSPSNEEVSAAQMAESEGALASRLDETGGKRHQNDFALWKASKAGEPSWDSSWGSGRPGWHIECSVIASDILGERLDMHSGGEDLKFPHHDNELAQSEACFGTQQWVNYFTHAGHLHIKGLKMSKSLKNFITIRQLLKTHSARQLRIAFLLQGWDEKMNFSDQILDDAKSKEKTFRSFFQAVAALSRAEDMLKGQVGWRMGDKDRKLAETLLNGQEKVHAALLDNFDTKSAMLALLNVISEGNAYMRLPDCKPAILTLRKIAQYSTFILKVFGVVEGNDQFGFCSDDRQNGNSSISKEQTVAPYIDTLAAFRERIRSAALSSNNKADPAIQAVLRTCDEVRDQSLAEIGVRLEDRPQGPMWSLDDPKILLAERAEKAEKEKALKRQKQAAQLDKLCKDLEKAQAAAVNPKTMFQTEEFLEWDEHGLPIKLANGDLLSAARMKKIKKQYEKQCKIYAEFMKKCTDDPDKYIREIEAQIDVRRELQ